MYNYHYNYLLMFITAAMITNKIKGENQNKVPNQRLLMRNDRVLSPSNEFLWSMWSIFNMWKYSDENCLHGLDHANYGWVPPITQSNKVIAPHPEKVADLVDPHSGQWLGENTFFTQCKLVWFFLCLLSRWGCAARFIWHFTRHGNSRRILGGSYLSPNPNHAINRDPLW